MQLRLQPRTPRHGRAPTLRTWSRWGRRTCRYCPAGLSLICTVPPTLTQLTDAGFAMPVWPAGAVALPVWFPVTPALQPSPRKSAHSSQLVPLVKLHIPYWLPSGLVIITDWPPTFTQLTDAGFAMPVWFVGALPVPAGAAGDVAGAARVAVVDGTDEGVCWVQPAITRPAPMQRHRTRITNDL